MHKEGDSNEENAEELEAAGSKEASGGAKGEKQPSSADRMTAEKGEQCKTEGEREFSVVEPQKHYSLRTDPSASGNDDVFLSSDEQYDDLHAEDEESGWWNDDLGEANDPYGAAGNRTHGSVDTVASVQP